MRSLVSIAVVAGGCFNPTYDNPSCGPAGECPNGLSCSAGACVRSSNGDGGGGDDGTTIDAFVIDAPAACLQWNPHFFSPCLIGSPNGPVNLTSGIYTYDTTLGTLVDAGHTAIAHGTFTVDQSGTPLWGMNVTDLVVASGATLRVVGAKPLIIAAWGTIEVDGSIDATSPTPPLPGQIPMAGGAGADPLSCGASTGMNGKFAANGSGGGGGGAFGGLGGTGAATNGAIGGQGGAVVAAPHIVRGGCAGGASGQGNVAYGGLGGGAIQLSARTTLTIKGSINAGGGGGQAGPQNVHDGGAGGGAGGFVGLEAETLVLQAGTIAANGGGGASGGPTNQPGFNGRDGLLGTVPAAGGPVVSGCPAPGGNGGALGGHDGQNAMNGAVCTGSGGGGGTGFVLLFSSQITSNVTTQSPAGLVNPF